jgi:serine/threonine protein phosphatase PrpC
VAGRASIVGAAETSVGKVRDHNEDSHFIDPEAGIFVVCDGMGGHAAGEVASAIAVQTVREAWSSDAMAAVADQWLAKGTPDAHKKLLGAIIDGVNKAHDAIIAETKADRTKTGMGTTIVGAMVIGSDMVFAHCGDSRAYIVRDGIAMQLTEDHTLLARLLAAGVDVDTEGEGSRFKSMLTNALGIGQDCKASTFVVPLADGDRFLLCSDGITEYVKEHEIGEVLGKAPSPARAAQKLVEMALQRGGGDNATALVVRVLEAGETSRPAEDLKRENEAIYACPLWAKVNPQQRLRALRIALPRTHAVGDKIPAQTLGDRVAWIIVDGQVEQDGELRGPGALLYPEALLPDRPLPDKDGLAITRAEVHALALRSDDFRELCEDDADLAEHLMAALADELGKPRKKIVIGGGADWRGNTDPRGHRVVAPVDDDLEHSETIPPTGFEDLARSATIPPPHGSLAYAPTLPPRPAEPAPSSDDVATAPEVKPMRRIFEPPPLRAVTEPPEPPSEPEPAPSGRATTDGGRARTNTDLGARPLPKVPALPGRTPPRGSPPPASLIVPQAETEAAVAKAIERISSDDLWDDVPEQFVAPATPPAAGPTIEMVVEAEPPPPPPPPSAAPLSEPEIQITGLAEAAASDDDGEPAEMIMTVEDDSARVVEIVKDTSSQTMTLTVNEPSEPEILVVQPGRAITADDTAMVAGAIETKRAKRRSDA